MRQHLLVALTALAACFSDSGPIGAITATSPGSTGTGSTGSTDTSSTTGPAEPTIATTGAGITTDATTADVTTNVDTTNVDTTDIGTTADPSQPVCGDALCDASEDCLSCVGDCGACPLGYPPGGLPDPLCIGDVGNDGYKCGGINGAFSSAAVNVGYYPFRIKPGAFTALYTCDDRTLQALAPGQGFAAQSVRNPHCSDNPPLRDPLAGFVFGYARGTGLSGWVPAEALEFVGYDGGTCADGPSTSAWQVANNPYDGCKPMPCEGVNTCAAANPIDPKDPNKSAAECSGLPFTFTRTIAAPYVTMHAAPGANPIQYVHAGDTVKVVYVTDGGWFFVELKTSSCPLLSPVGLRGWLENKAENFVP